MSTLLDECRTQVCPCCRELALDPLADTCRECGWTADECDRKERDCEEVA